MSEKGFCASILESMLERAFEFAGWLLPLVGWLVVRLLLGRWRDRAARENARQFEKADAKSITAWKYFPF